MIDSVFNFSEDDAYSILMRMGRLSYGIIYYDSNLLSAIADDVERYLDGHPLVLYKNITNGTSENGLATAINGILRLFDIFLDGIDVDAFGEDEGIYSERRYLILISYIVLSIEY